MERQQWEELRDSQENHRAQAEHDAISKKVKEREVWRIRQQRHREKIRSERTSEKVQEDNDNDSDGSESYLTKKRKQIVELEGHEPKAITAEESRPHCWQFKEDHRLNKKDTGQKPVHETKAAVNMNWKQPVIWAGIELAACQTGKPWSPCAIAVRAARNNPAVYGKLREQVVGRWIEEGKSEWKESVLDLITSGKSLQILYECTPELRLQNQASEYLCTIIRE
ncbi:hypothetical protein FB446DRAFT_833088 [Lentinula raphanica]|nr:hypothetical protein FB446DRAFT_833088 [Lentinula raphanica]